MGGRIRERLVQGQGATLSARYLIGAFGLMAATLVAMLIAPLANAALPNGRVYEMVSPVKKSGNKAGAIGKDAPGYALSIASGDRLLYQVTNSVEGATRGIELYAVANRTASGWRSMSPIPFPKAPINYLNYNPFAIQVSEDLTRFAYNLTGGGLVPGNPSKTELNNPFDTASAQYIAGPGEEISWVTEPKIANPNPAVGNIPSQSLFTPVGGSPDLSTYYFNYHGTLVAEDASRAPHVPTEVYEVENAPQGLYRWHAGELVNYGSLPDGSYDPYGAVAAGGVPETQFNNNMTPADFNNQVSAAGNQAVYISPDPKSGSGRVSQLYVRRDDAPSVLVSRSELTGLPAPHGAKGLSPANTGSGGPPKSYAYGSEDGSHVYFVSEDALTADAPGGTVDKSYLYDVEADELEYLPGVFGRPIAARPDLSSFLYVRRAETVEGAPPYVGRIGVWNDGDATTLTEFGENPNAFAFNGRVTADGETYFFETNQVVPGSFNSGTGIEQIYSYDVPDEDLSCISCPPVGVTPTSNAQMSHNQTAAPAVDPIGKFKDARGISPDGSRVFFDTADPLVIEDSNGVRDVYMWEGGKAILISSGISPLDSYFLDNSESGGDVFFATTEGLDPADTDEAYDVYDARVGGGFPVASPPAPCFAGCQAPQAPPAFSQPGSVDLRGRGNVKPKCAKGKVRKQGKCVKKQQKPKGKQKRAAGTKRGGGK